jgi:cell surface protein SprA
LASERGIDVNNPANLDGDGYPLGYSEKQSGSFIAPLLAAYSGSDVQAFSGFSASLIPNWVKYSGLMRYGLFKRNFKRFSLQHNYRASYTVNQYRSNFDYDKALMELMLAGTFNKTIMSNVNLVEQFSPLIRMDFELKVR